MSKLAKAVVICGSMSFYKLMLKLHEDLAQVGVPSVIPSDDGDYRLSFVNTLFESYKKAASFRHIVRIRNKHTYGILVVNPEKHGISDYIGPNTFAEIAIAFAHRKRIYLFGQIPEFYQDEISAWGGVSLGGDLSVLVSDFQNNTAVDDSQPWLFPEFDNN